MDASRIHCPYTERVRTFNRQKDASRHARNLDMKEGRLNAYVCEVCNAFFVRIDELNIHQQKIHKFSKDVFFHYLTALVYGLLFILSDTFNKLHVHKSIKSGPVKVG